MAGLAENIMNLESQTGASPRLADRLASIGVSPKKAVEYLAMFLVLGTIYYCDLTRGYKASACNTEPVIIQFSDLPLIFLKYFLYTAWPFALVALIDSNWTSKDAGNVFLAAYIGANMVWFHHTGCGFCIFAASFRTIPFLLGAMIAHRLGAWRHRGRGEE
jgi:hypothetical protein